LELTVFLAVLLAALMHAGWNVLVKSKLDRFSAVFLLQAVLGVFGLGLMIVFGLPPAEAWPYALASAIVHTFYLIFLAKAYEAGDFAVTYPIARGSAPLFTLIGSLLFANDVISAREFAAILLLISGLVFLAMGKSASGVPQRKAVIYALLTAFTISCYTLLDGIGGRVSGNPSQYAGLAFFLFGLFITATAIGLRGFQILRDVAPHWKAGVGGGTVSAVAYWIIIWCMSQAPIAMVAALRETSVLFGLALSSLILKERLTPMRIAGGVLIVGGAALLQLARTSLGA
jgi:drug/metabolite transporter (DMT)-like permease